MSEMNAIVKDVLFDRYGDISFVNGDIETIDDKGDILYQNVLHRLISNFGDYKNYKNLGADFSGFIGRPVTPKLEEEVRLKVAFALTNDDFLDLTQFSVTTLTSLDRILVRVEVFIGSGKTTAERFVVNTIFNSSTGLLYASAT